MINCRNAEEHDCGNGIKSYSEFKRLFTENEENQRSNNYLQELRQGETSREVWVGLLDFGFSNIAGSLRQIRSLRGFLPI